ncbi:hypothetical protein D3C87_1480800 [compost metagenome]
MRLASEKNLKFDFFDDELEKVKKSTSTMLPITPNSIDGDLIFSRRKGSIAPETA